MTPQPLLTILCAFDAPVPTPIRLPIQAFAGEATAQVQALVAHHLLVPGPLQTSLPCAGCKAGCQADVVWRRTAVGVSHPVLVCAKMGWGDLPIDPAWLGQWETSPAHLAAAVSQLLRCHHPPDMLIPDRCWWVGTLTRSWGSGDVFLARGTTWPDAPAIFAHVDRLHEATHPIILTPYATVPVPSPFSMPVRSHSLTSLLQVQGGHVRLRRMALDQVARDK